MMERPDCFEESKISIGQLAQMYKLSNRTLRLYHDVGLLIPYFIDEKTGYRYYTNEQIPRLEMIIQMKNIGLSLKQIKTMLDARDLSIFEALLNEQIDILEEKISEFKTTRNSLIKKLESCKHFRNPPALDTFFIEFIPKRYIYSFEIEPYSLHGSSSENSAWTRALEEVKTQMISYGIPLTYFHQVSCIISQAPETGELTCRGAFISAEDTLGSAAPVTQMQASTYACMYRKYISGDSVSENEGLQRLLGYIGENNYRIVGDMYGEVVAETSVFDYDNRDILVKLQVPVKITD